MFNWVKELKDEIKAAVKASVEVQREVVRLQESVRRLETDLRDVRDSFTQSNSRDQESMLALRDRIAALEAQQTSLHNDARILAARYSNQDDSGTQHLNGPDT